MESNKVFPEWLLESKERGRLSVTFSPESKQELDQIVKSGGLDFYSSYTEVEQVITEVF